jgi:16S rRNA processing protein RimM
MRPLPPDLPCPEDWIIIGRIAGFHGIRGSVRVESWSDIPQRFNHVKSIFWINQRGQQKSLTVTDVRTYASGWLLRFDGYSTRNAAEELRFGYLAIPQHTPRKLPQNTFLISDMIGMNVFLESGKSIGCIHTIYQQMGIHDIYEIKGPDREWLLPATTQVIRHIDIVQHRMTVRIPEGL